MKFYLAMLLWLLMGAALSAGLVMAVNGSFWLLGLGTLAFIGMVAKIGCLSHD